jgi:hypothetical protein
MTNHQTAAALQARLQSAYRQEDMITEIKVTVTDGDRSLLVDVAYSDGRSSQSIFIGRVSAAELDEVVQVVKNDLAANLADVFDRKWEVGSNGFDPDWDGWTPPVPFEPVTHSWPVDEDAAD